MTAMRWSAVCAALLLAGGWTAAQDKAGGKKVVNPDVKHPEGVERDEALEVERELGWRFTKRETRDCIVAIVGPDKDAKALAKYAVVASKVFRTTLPKEMRNKPLAGPKIMVYSIPPGDKFEAFLTKVMKPLRYNDKLLEVVRSSQGWYHQEYPAIVIQKRNKVAKIHIKEQGSHVAHGLGHAFFVHGARISGHTAPRWMSEGYATWMDRQVYPKCRFCCVPMSALAGYAKRKSWKKTFRNQVLGDNDRKLEDVVKAKKLDDFREGMMAKAASVCGWLATTRPKNFWKLPHAIGALGPEEGFKAELKKTIKEVEAEWREWFKKTQ
jgi:hypothetical protein